jgi:hypothetical protein
MEKNVQLKYRLYRRRKGIFYWQENGSKNQGTLRTRDKRAAEKILHAMNESQRQPTLNLSIARAYLAAHDPKMSQRTWQAVMNEMATHGRRWCRCRAGKKSNRSNRERRPRHRTCSYHFVIAVWSAKGAESAV